MKTLIILGIGILVVAFIIIATQRPRQADYPNLQTLLFNLTIAPNPSKYASKHDLNYTDGKVDVVIELQSKEAVLPNKYPIEVDERNGNLIYAWVPVNGLLPLSNEPQIKFIRAPYPIQTNRSGKREP